MSLTYSCDVFCGGCPDWVHGTTGGSGIPLAVEARKRAKANGWTRPRVLGERVDLCLECSKLPR